MEFTKLFIILFFNLEMALTILSNPTIAKNTPQDFVNAHTPARSEAGVPPLMWNATLAAYAKDYAMQRSPDCAMLHSEGPYGENLAAGSWDMSANEAVDMWVEEKSNYNVVANICLGGECLHYTQVVWRDTVRVGCGSARCDNGWTFVVCSYDPPGNYIGQRPF